MAQVTPEQAGGALLAVIGAVALVVYMLTGLGRSPAETR